MGLGGRLHLAWISSAEARKFADVVTGFVEQVRALGPNPLPGLLGSAAIGVPVEKPPAYFDKVCRQCAGAVTVEQ